MLRQLPQVDDPNLLTAAIPFADAGVYRLSDGCALVQSVDFFTPIVDDPATFGSIAAANALSDLYAMGATPLTALNLIGFPDCLDQQLLVEILRAGALKVQEAGAVIVGGHTVGDDEPKYGLAVTGIVDPARMISTVGARPGDVLILTKPLGTGILATAVKGKLADPETVRQLIDITTALNKEAADIARAYSPRACTDITGFGLAGHLLEMARASGKEITLTISQVPFIQTALAFARMGFFPAGAYTNKKYCEQNISVAAGIDAIETDMLFDPQTSGGLIFALPEEKARPAVAALNEKNAAAQIIGEVTGEKDCGHLIITP